MVNRALLKVLLLPRAEKQWKMYKMIGYSRLLLTASWYTKFVMKRGKSYWLICDVTRLGFEGGGTPVQFVVIIIP